MPVPEIINDHPTLSLPIEELTRVMVAVVQEEGATIGDLAVILTEHEQVLEMNRVYLDHDYLTDVLAFDLRDDADGPIDGEIYVDLDTAQERCHEFGASFEQEATRYAIHGLLHLIGYRDSTDDAAAQMKRLEDVYLARYQGAV